MSLVLEIPLTCFKSGLGALGLVSLLFGIFTAARPRQSIGLYQWIMARFNWRVVPIDEPREVRTTRALGLAMIVLSLALEAVLFRVGI